MRSCLVWFYLSESDFKVRWFVFTFTNRPEDSLVLSIVGLKIPSVKVGRTIPLGETKLGNLFSLDFSGLQSGGRKT